LLRYEGSLNDFVSYLPSVSVGGLIWLDDIAHEPGVTKAWNEIKNGLDIGDCSYEYWDWGVGEIEGGKRDSSNRMGIDGVWICRTR